MKAKNRVLVGLLLMALSVFVLTPVGTFVLSELDPNPPFFSPTLSYPSSTNINAPSIISQEGSAKDFWCATRDVETYVKAGAMTCDSTDGSYHSGEQALIYDSDIDIGGEIWSIWKWDAPYLESGKVYIFHWWVADLDDNLGHLYTYGAYGYADGYFILNGITITSTSQRIISGSPTINVRFIPTYNPGAIVSIRVKVWNWGKTILYKDSTLPKVGNEYIGDNYYTVSSAGAYVIEGFIVMSSMELQKLSIVGVSGGINLPYKNLLFGAIFMIGLVLVIQGNHGGKR